MKTLVTALTQNGLSYKEALLYMALLELGSSEVAPIATRANVKRSTAYLLLESLTDRGYISTDGSNPKRYYAGNPEQLFGEQRVRLAALENALPGLLGLASQSAHKPGVRFFVGITGIKAIYEETLKQPPGTEILSIGNAEAVEASIDNFVEWYIARRAERPLPMRSLMPHTEEGLLTANRNPQEARSTRTLDPEDFTENVELMIYSSYIAAVSFVESELIGIIIESKVLAQVHRQLFEIMWRTARPYP